MTIKPEVLAAVAISYTPGKLDATAPETIWLQIDTSDSNSNRREPYPDSDGVSWCQDSIGGLEVQYVRSDLALAELTRLSEIADTVEPLVVRMGEVTTRLERADALLRELHATVRGESPHLLDEDSGGNGTLDLSIQSHLSEPRT